jgi:hypothetical protein
MDVKIRPYAESMIPATKAFNGRLREAGVGRQFPEKHVSDELPKREGSSVYQQYYLAVDGDDVRGGYVLKHQLFCFRGETVPGAFCRLPISEAAIDRTYDPVDAQVVQDAQNKRSVLVNAYVGGAEGPYAQLLRSLGWGLYPVPFLFKIRRPFRCLRGFVALRHSAARRMALDAAAFSGLGWLGLEIMQRSRRRPPPVAETTAWDEVPGFGDWADELWQDCRTGYAMVAVRDADVLTALYPEHSERFLRLRVTQEDRVIGWAVVLDTTFSGHEHYGELRVGSIADCLARPENAHQVVHAATRYLERRGVDLIVSNQSHAAWCAGLSACGYTRGPTNFVMAASRDVLTLLDPFERSVGAVHVNRGDGDGPAQL